MDWMLDREIRQEMPDEWNSIVPTRVFMQEAENLVEQARNRDIVLRVVGGLGIALKCKVFREFGARLGRAGTGIAQGQEYSDIDLVSYKKFRDRVKSFFNDLGYAKRRATLSSAASERQIYYHPKAWFYVDVFFDRLLVANHPIDFTSRLELDYPTVTPTDFLLEKIQMWEAFSAKDLKDCLLLLKSCPVQDKDELDSEYIAKLLAQDWGFWYTATTNLKKIHGFIAELDKYGVEAGIDPTQISIDDRKEISGKIENILMSIDDEPKTFGWKMRAKIGDKKKWYNPVERPDTVGGFGIWEAIK